MSVVSKLIIKSCERNGLQYLVHDPESIVVSIGNHLVIANNLGLNSSSVDKLCVDKFFSHQLLSSVVKMPDTFSWVDPQAPQPYEGFSKSANRDEIVEEVTQLFSQYERLVLKPNSKSRGINVFVCQNHEEVSRAVAKIFDLNSHKYDHVLLVQEHLSIAKEYRVVVYNKRVQFMYLKNNKHNDSKFVGNVSPLHYENASAELITDASVLQRVEEWLAPLFDQIELVYAGIDVVELADGSLQLLEINGQPGYSIFVEQNGTQQLDTFFDTVVTDIAKGYEKK